MNEKKCTSCGSDIPANAKFCEKCGQPAPTDSPAAAEVPGALGLTCPACGKTSPSGMRFCESCGTALQTGEAPPIGQQAAYIPTPPPAPTPKKQGIKRKPLIAVVSIVLVAALLITGFWQPGFFLNGGKYPDPFHSGSSSAFSTTPVPGFTISADANSLDHDREFVVSEAPEETFIDVSTTMAEYGILLMNLYDLDAGPEDNTRFPGVYDMTFDLNELEIPAALQEFTTVYRISDDGDATELVCTLRNGKLSCQSDKNCFIALGTILYWGGGIVVAGAVSFFGARTGIEYNEKWEGMSGKTLVQKDICDGLYRLTWAVDDNTPWRIMKNKLNNLYIKIKDELNQEIQAAGTWNGYAMAYAYNRLLASKIANNQEYQTLLQEFKALTETIVNDGTPQIAQVAAAVTKAHNYLTAQGFTARTNVTDIILVSDWPSGTALGYSKNPDTSAPYIRLNMTVFPLNSMTAAPADVADDMYLTVTHEMFHVFQSNYTTIDWNSNIIFWEATAVAVEAKAFNDYQADGTITTTPDLTPSNSFETLSTTVGEMPPGGADVARANGYTLSRFVLYIQSNYSMKLKNLMNAFASSGNFIGALKGATGMTDEQLGSVYVGFCRVNAQEFYNRHKAAASGSGIAATLVDPVQLSSGAVKAQVPVGDMPLSAYFREFKVDTASIAGGQYALLLASDPSLLTKPNYNLVNTTAGVTATPKGLFYPVSSAASAYLFEIHSYAQSDGINASYTAYLLTPPANPSVTLDEGKTMSIQMPPASIAARDGKIDGYLVTITSSDGVVTNKHVPYSQWGDPLTQRLKRLTNETENVSFAVTVKEYIKNGSTYYFGPVSNDGGSYLSEDVLDEELLDAQAGTGEITISMLWSTADDLDLHVITPSGAEIYYSNKVADGGTLDVDQNASSDNIVANPIENIYFQSPLPGTYKVFIVNYSDRTESGASDYMVRVTVGGQSQTYQGALDGTGSSVDIVEINYGTQGN